MGGSKLGRAVPCVRYRLQRNEADSRSTVIPSLNARVLGKVITFRSGRSDLVIFSVQGKLATVGRTYPAVGKLTPTEDFTYFY